MFSLLSGLYWHMTRKDEFFVLILGLDNAGKTTLLEKFKSVRNTTYRGIPLEKISPTVGMNVGKVELGRTRFIFWDLGGQPDLQNLWDKYYQECHAVVFVIDSADPTRLGESRSVFEKMVDNPHLEGVPLLILANKQDLEDAMSVQDIKTEFNKVAAKLGRRDCKVKAVSAKQADQLEAGLLWLVESVRRNPDRPAAQQEME
eukprot:m.92837 g.92837  ORF g.92837 m.92837 type:complete len:202 (-) comp51179_c0_seq4:262-867(-)